MFKIKWRTNRTSGLVSNSFECEELGLVWFSTVRSRKVDVDGKRSYYLKQYSTKDGKLNEKRIYAVLESPNAVELSKNSEKYIKAVYKEYKGKPSEY